MNIHPNHDVVDKADGKDAGQAVFLPAADIYETPDSLLIRCDLPGVSEEDLEITLHNRVLSIQGTQREVARDDLQNLAREYQTGRYRRTFNLNRDLDESTVSARLRNGVLEINLAKVRESEPRRIRLEN
jgi:HSP20 family protein